MNWFLKALKNYASISGRAKRMEFWKFVFLNAIILLGFGYLVALGYVHKDVFFIYFIGIIIPFFSKGIRRLHDTGRSGWWIFMPILPFVGIFSLMQFCVKEAKKILTSMGEVLNRVNTGKMDKDVSDITECYMHDFSVRKFTKLDYNRLR